MNRKIYLPVGLNDGITRQMIRFVFGNTWELQQWHVRNDCTFVTFKNVTDCAEAVSVGSFLINGMTVRATYAYRCYNAAMLQQQLQANTARFPVQMQPNTNGVGNMIYAPGFQVQPGNVQLPRLTNAANYQVQPMAAQQMATGFARGVQNLQRQNLPPNVVTYPGNNVPGIAGHQSGLPLPVARQPLTYPGNNQAPLVRNVVPNQIYLNGPIGQNQPIGAVWPGVFQGNLLNYS